MELPIVPKYEGTYISLHDQNVEEKVRILDIDDTFLVSVINRDIVSKKFLNVVEIAFTSLREAEDYLRDDLSIDIPLDPEEKQCKWRNHDYD